MIHNGVRPAMFDPFSGHPIQNCRIGAGIFHNSDDRFSWARAKRETAPAPTGLSGWPFLAGLDSVKKERPKPLK